MTLAYLISSRTKNIVLSLVFTGLWTCFCAAVKAETVVEYDRELTSISRELHAVLEIEKAKPGSATNELKSLLARLRPEMDVSVSKDETIHVDMRWISSGVDGVAKWEPKSRMARIEHLVDRVDAQRGAVLGIPFIGQTSIDRSKAMLASNLAGSEYKPSWQERLTQKIQSWLYGLLEKLNIPPSVGIFIGWLTVVVAAIAFIVAVIFIIWRLLVAASLVRFNRPISHTKPQQAPRTPTQTSVLDEAERHAAAGRYKEAFRAVYLAAILALDRAKLVKYIDGVTNWEYLRALTKQDRAETVPPFKAMTGTFDRLIYGEQPISESDYLECRSHYTALIEVLK